jgi:DNA adenine methylase
METEKLKSPFPWFGGKSSVASEVWRRFGVVHNYIEPFAGSLAVLLAARYRPNRICVNDLDAMITNFWRALQADPDGVMTASDRPRNEIDLKAVHKHLQEARPLLREKLLLDHRFFDLELAGLWVWCCCSCIASRADLDRGYGRGIHRLPLRDRAVRISYFRQLSDVLRDAVIMSGDWFRCVESYSSTTYHGLTAVFLDPPYRGDFDTEIYQDYDPHVSRVCRSWAAKVGADPLFRIALCGTEGEHVMPAGWQEYRWKRNGGRGNRGKSRREREKTARKTESIWFSPHCHSQEIDLFTDANL